MKIARLKEKLRNFWRTFKNNWLLFKESKIGVFGLGIIVFFVVIALLAPILDIRDPIAFRAPEEDVITIERYWVNDLNQEGKGWGTLGGNTSITFVPQGISFNPWAEKIYLGASNKVFSLHPDLEEVEVLLTTTIGDISTPVVAVNYGDNYGTNFQDYAVFVGTSEGYFYAINDTEPLSKSVKKLDSAVSSISVFNYEFNPNRGLSDVIYVGTKEGTLYAYLATNYSELWNISLDGEVHMTPHPFRGEGSYPIYSPSLTKDGETLVVGTGNGTLYAISTTDHTEKWNWTYNETESWSSSPIIVVEGENEIVYLGTDDGWLYAFYVINGTEIKEWKDLEYEKRGEPEKVGIQIKPLGEIEPDGGVLTTPAIYWGGENGTFIFVGSSSGHFYKISRGSIGTADEYRPAGSTVDEFKEEMAQDINYRFDVQPMFYPTFGEPKYIFAIENHDNGTAQLDDDKGMLYAIDLIDLNNVSWKISEEKDTKEKFSAIISPPIAWASGELTPSVWFVTSDVVVSSYAASGKYLAPLGPTWITPLESGNTYWLGTDIIGHDVFSQIVFGARTALLVGFMAAFFSILIGVIIGLVSGYFGGKIESILMRFTDVILVLPFLPLVIVLAAVLGPSIWNIIIVIAILGWGGVARVIRAAVLSLKERPFIDSARVTGASNVRIMFRHIAPNILPLAFLYMTFAVASAILVEAALSFIGLGDFTQPSWGILLHYIQQSNTLAYWWLLYPPGFCIAFLCMGFFLVGRAFEQIVNPRLRRRR